MGGVKIAFRNVYVVLVSLIIIFVIMIFEVIDFKKGYTDLHHRVNQIEWRMKKCCQ